MEKIYESLYFIVCHQWKYFWAILASKWYKPQTDNPIKEIIFTARESDKDWIFGAKMRRLSRFSALKSKTYFSEKLQDLPEADGYFYIYQNYFCRYIRSNPNVLNKKNIVMFTHANWTKKYSKTHVVWCLNKANYVICLNASVKSNLIDLGVKPEILKVLHIGTSAKFFKSHERVNGGIGFCSAFSKRKNPNLVFDIIKNMPEKQCYLIGNKWEKFARFNEMMALPNFTYFNNMAYENYPELYKKIDVFVSPSLVEGGPVPILESMMSNCVPVASRTGYCQDLIEHGENGFLFNTNANYKEVIPLIEKAFALKTDVRETVLPYTWENCSKYIDKLFLTEESQ